MVSSLSIVFPAYNEEANIGESIRRALEVGSEVTKSLEVIAVNDGSRDGTREVIEEWAKKDSRVRLIDHTLNTGYGQTVWDGLRASTKDWVFFTDGDGQFDLREISRLTDRSSDYSVVLGFRCPRKDPLIRLVNAKLWNGLVRILFGLKVRDIDCAFKLFKREILEDLTIQSGGATFSTELLLRLKRKNISFLEVPVTHLPRRAGSQTGANLNVIRRAFKELFKLYKTTDLGRPFFREIIKFGVVGAAATVVDFSLLNISLSFLEGEQRIYLATFIGFLGGTITGYLLNNKWTYRRLKRDARIAALGQYGVVGGVGLLLTESIMHYFAVEQDMNHNLSKVIAVGVVFFWNFFGNRYWTFNEKVR